MDDSQREFERIVAMPRGPERRRAMRKFGMNVSPMDWSDDELIAAGRKPSGPDLP